MSLNHCVPLYFFTGLTLTSCGVGFIPTSEEESWDEQGGGGLVIEMPFAAGIEKMCTQGAHGIHSHTDVSTQFDLDLDTNNDADEEVSASVSGIARVHMESASSNFGYHINIDLGNGTYVVIAHLSDIFIQDAQEVTVGQLLGYEGRTGNATGDHVHIGLHEGDAGEKAENGTSIPTTYRAANQSDGTGMAMINSEEFSCGIRSQGDPQDGDFYESDLATNLWHPDGTLIMTPDNARVYVLEDGETRWIENESTFWGLAYDFNDVTLVSESELACYGQGEDIVGETLVDAALDSDDDLWLIVGDASDSGRYRALVRDAGWEDVMTSWGLDYTSSNRPGTYSDSSSYMTNWPASSNYVGLRDGTLVKEEDASDVYVISNGFALPIKTWDVYLLQNFYPRDILTVEAGTVNELHEVGNCATDQMCLDFEAITTCGGGLELSDAPGEGGGSSTDEEEEEEEQEEEEDEEDVEDEEDQEDQEEEDEEEEVEDEEDEEEEEEEQEEEETRDESMLTVEVDYPANYPALALTVQPIFAISSLGDYWLATTYVEDDDEVSWSDEADYSGLLGVRLNVNVDSDGNGANDDWYCYGHYATAYLEYGVAVDITLDSDSWDENDLVTWSPGNEGDTSLGCSALLWFGSTSSISEGAVY